jgi:bacteriocin biosynthesis cyclodehydratase domain-containing protein
VVISADEVLIQFGTRSHPSELLRDRDASGAMAHVFARLLQGPSTIEELLTAVPLSHRDGAAALVKDLVTRGILADVQSSPVDQYFSYAFEEQRPARVPRVGFIGAGPLGARVAQNLARQNLADIVLLDDRPVDETWAAFMPLGTGHASLGSRADAAATAHLSRVTCLDGAVDASGVEAAVATTDLVVLAFEQVDLRTAQLVNRFALGARKPWLHLTIDGNFGIVGPLFHPPDTACYNDYRTLVVAATPSALMARKHREHLLRRGSGSFFTGLPSYADIVGGHASVAATHYLLRQTSFALGRVMLIDFERMEIDVEDVFKLPRCPVCGVDKAAYRPALYPR